MAEKDCNCIGNVYVGLLIGGALLAGGFYIGRQSTLGSVEVVASLREKLCVKCQEHVSPVEPPPKKWKPEGAPVGSSDEE